MFQECLVVQLLLPAQNPMSPPMPLLPPHCSAWDATRLRNSFPIGRNSIVQLSFGMLRGCSIVSLWRISVVQVTFGMLRGCAICLLAGRFQVQVTFGMPRGGAIVSQQAHFIVQRALFHEATQ